MRYTIITATYNAEKYLERLLVSVLGQSYPDFEWLVQDGGSTDGTLDILKKYPDVRLKWRSESDSGIYDAWNKAVSRSTGDWAIFLGADDMFLHKDVLALCHRHIKRLKPEIRFAYAAMVRGSDLQVTEVNNLSMFDVYARFNERCGPPIPSMFFHMPMLRREPFVTKYKIAGDADLVARLYTYDNIARIPVMAVYMEKGGVSTDLANWDLMVDETHQVLTERILPKAEEMMRGCLKHYFDRDISLEQ